MGAVPELFLDLVPQLGLRDMPDPWYSGDYERVLDLTEAAAAALVRQLARG